MSFQVDIEYPPSLFEQHKDFPLAPQKLNITPDLIEGKVVEYMENNDFPYTTQTRLTQDFLPKNNYVVHAEILKFYVSQGLVVKKIHRGITFLQSNWMKEFVEFNTQQRIAASNDFEKDFYKLMVSVSY